MIGATTQSVAVQLGEGLPWIACAILARNAAPARDSQLLMAICRDANG
jgi:hypothetical protein